MRHRVPDPRAPRQTPAVQIARVRAGETGQGAAGNVRAAREARQTWYVQPNLQWAVTPLGDHSLLQLGNLVLSIIFVNLLGVHILSQSNHLVSRLINIPYFCQPIWLFLSFCIQIP